MPAITNDPDPNRPTAHNLTLYPVLRLTTDLIRKYRENAESDGRQIRQLDVERSEAIYAKNKMEVSQQNSFLPVQSSFSPWSPADEINALLWGRLASTKGPSRRGGLGAKGGAGVFAGVDG